jgi:RHS repeat-associated protein
VWQHITQAGRDALLLVQLWAGADAGERTAWLHSNHLGAPELATDGQGQVIWQARYSPFGAAQVLHPRPAGKNGQAAAPFALHLRLPGQMFDPETGLHYNRQCYYDPQAGQYLTPDPLGNPDGPNPYAYVVVPEEPQEPA